MAVEGFVIVAGLGNVARGVGNGCTGQGETYSSGQLLSILVELQAAGRIGSVYQREHRIDAVDWARRYLGIGKIGHSDGGCGTLRLQPLLPCQVDVSLSIKKWRAQQSWGEF